MPRFVTQRGYDFLNGINTELINEVMDIDVLLYKINPKTTKENMYGESVAKQYYSPVQVSCIVDSQPRTSAYEGFGPDSTQTINFYFHRETLRLINLMPEIGDIVDWKGGFYEIDHVYGSEIFGKQVDYQFSIRCETHMTRRSKLNIERRVL